MKWIKTEKWLVVMVFILVVWNILISNILIKNKEDNRKNLVSVGDRITENEKDISTLCNACLWHFVKKNHLESIDQRIYEQRLKGISEEDK